MTLPKVGTENSVKGPGYHHEHGARAENTGGEQQELVDHEQVADVVIASYCALEGRQQVDAIHHGGGTPASSLIVELVECFRGIGEGVGGGGVLDPVALLQQQRAQPSVLP